MRKNLPTIILIFVFLIGVSLLVYPTFSDWYNSFHQSRVVVNYAETVAKIDEEDYQRTLSDAYDYNSALAKKGIIWEPTEADLAEYNKLLSISGDGVMAYIEIPKINVLLPIYHGTGPAVLQNAIGHIEGSSLPVGGESTNCLLSGHRGMPNARLFTDLDKIVTGDTFMIRTLDEVLTYEVDNINIVLPYDLSLIRIEDGEDYCTLITCTPYGINTHRLIVRGHRIETEDDMSIRVTADAFQVDTKLVAAAIAVPVLLILLVVLLFVTRKRKR